VPCSEQNHAPLLKKQINKQTNTTTLQTPTNKKPKTHQKPYKPKHLTTGRAIFRNERISPSYSTHAALDNF